MAKRSRSTNRNANGTPSSLTKLLSVPVKATPRGVPSYIKPQLTITPLQSGDQRFYAPDASIRPAPSVQRKSSRLVLRDPIGRSVRAQSLGPPAAVGRAIPDDVAHCVRRKARREVLFAKRSTNGATSRRRNQWSKLRC